MLLIALLVSFQVKHLLADYFLQGRYMLGKFKPFPAFILPLAAHALVHAIFTAIICIIVGVGWPVVLKLSLLDFTAHFIVDRLKASPKLLGRFKALDKNSFTTAIVNGDSRALKGNIYFWWALGFDQFLHHLTHYYIIWVIVKSL